jgi:hypothetical protein
MVNVDWDLALARVLFVQAHVLHMRKEVAMKNEKLFAAAAFPQPPQQEEARQAPAAEQRQPWPAHRRFWHRAFHRPAKPRETAGFRK